MPTEDKSMSWEISHNSPKNVKYSCRMIIMLTTKQLYSVIECQFCDKHYNFFLIFNYLKLFLLYYLFSQTLRISLLVQVVGIPHWHYFIFTWLLGGYRFVEVNHIGRMATWVEIYRSSQIQVFIRSTRRASPNKNR